MGLLLPCKGVPGLAAPSITLAGVSYMQAVVWRLVLGMGAWMSASSFASIWPPFPPLAEPQPHPSCLPACTLSSASRFVHDGLVHRRFPVGPIADLPAMKRIVVRSVVH